LSKCLVRRLILQGVTLAVLTAATLHPFEPALAVDVPASTLEPDPCAGDETLTYVPVDPMVGQELFIVASSAQHHRGVTLAGTPSSSYQDEYIGQLGWVWRWRVIPKFSGQHRFRLYVDATTPCGEITVNVARSGQANDDNDNSNGNDNNSNSNSNSNNDNTEEARPPKITAVTPATSNAGGRVTIKGQHFGRSRSTVGGKVIIGNSQVATYLAWDSNEIVVLVPNGAQIGTAQNVYVLNDADFDKGTINISLALGSNENNNNTEQVRPPKVTAVTPTTSFAGGRVTIKGQNFGQTQASVGGKVIIGNSQVVNYLSWNTSEIVVLVPNSVQIGPAQDVLVVNDADFDKGTIDIGVAPGSNENNDNTEQARPPTVSTVTPSISCAGGRVTIAGQNFGQTRAGVGGQVFIAGAQVGAYLSWDSTEIVVLVPNGALTGPAQDVYVVNDADFDKDTIDIGAAPC
jgi:hypothetical protein